MPFGWLGNMSPHPVVINKTRYPTAEHAFQAMRFPSGHRLRENLVRVKSPMDAKLIARRLIDEAVIFPHSDQDIELMREVTWEKLIQHGLTPELLATESELIVEDVTKRQSKSGSFWGAAKIDGEWVGQNELGKIWMEHRERSFLNMIWG